MNAKIVNHRSTCTIQNHTPDNANDLYIKNTQLEKSIKYETVRLIFSLITGLLALWSLLILFKISFVSFIDPFIQSTAVIMVGISIFSKSRNAFIRKSYNPILNILILTGGILVLIFSLLHLLIIIDLLIN
jgi:uncharacterized protein YacL